jgi:hypothetical protein
MPQEIVHGMAFFRTFLMIRRRRRRVINNPAIIATQRKNIQEHLHRNPHQRVPS